MSESICECGHPRSEHVLSPGPRDTCAGTTERGTPCGCPRYTLRVEHEQSAPESENWFRSGKLVIKSRGIVMMAEARDEKTAEQIVTEHRLAALVPELVEVLRRVRASFFVDAQSGGYVERGKLTPLNNAQHPWIPGARAPQVIEVIDAALNVAAQQIVSTRKHDAGTGGLKPSSGYRGASCMKGLYFASIYMNGRQKYFGGFKSIEDAARGYDELARKHFGKRAILNFPESHELRAALEPQEGTRR